MKDKVYKFLDEYLGGKINCKPRPTGLFRTWSDNYEIVSSNGTMIFWFSVRLDAFKIYRSEELCNTIESFFPIDPEDSWKYIRDWFGKRHQMKKLEDLFKFIPHDN